MVVPCLLPVAWFLIDDWSIDEAAWGGLNKRVVGVVALFIIITSYIMTIIYLLNEINDYNSI